MIETGRGGAEVVGAREKKGLRADESRASANALTLPTLRKPRRASRPKLVSTRESPSLHM